MGSQSAYVGARNVLSRQHRACTQASEHAAALGVPDLFVFDAAQDLPAKEAPRAAGGQAGVGAGCLSAARGIGATMSEPPVPPGAGKESRGGGASSGAPGGGSGGEAGVVNKRKAVGPNLADEAVLRAIQQRVEAAKIAEDKASQLLREKEQKEKERRLKGAAAAGATEGFEACSNKSKQVTAPLPAGKGSKASAKTRDGGKDSAIKVKPDTVIKLQPEHTHSATVASPPTPSTPPTPPPALLPAPGGKQKRKHADESQPHSDADAAPGSKKHKKKDKKEKEGKKGKKERSGRGSASPPGSHSGFSLAKIQLKLSLPKGP